MGAVLYCTVSVWSFLWNVGSDDEYTHVQYHGGGKYSTVQYLESTLLLNVSEGDGMNSPIIDAVVEVIYSSLIRCNERLPHTAYSLRTVFSVEPINLRRVST